MCKMLYIWTDLAPHSASAGVCVSPLVLVLGCGAVVAVQILHEFEEGQFIEENLGDLHQEVLATVLQRAAHKLIQRVLFQNKTVENDRFFS